MCCFSGPVRQVAGTRIFGRLSGTGTQFLAYSMTYTADEPVAMILPLPTARGKGEKAVRFIDLSGYPAFFAALDMPFVPSPSRGGVGAGAAGGGFGRPQLAVHDVGQFVASFVPSQRDFDRLDPRFRLPRETWNRLPVYRDYGFAVFQLRPSEDNQPRGVHPMAFEFATRHPDQIFFPTVHIHDGQVHTREHFDHALYCQGEAVGPQAPIDAAARQGKWQVSARPAGEFVQPVLAAGLVALNRPLRKQELKGLLPNRDIFVALR